MNKKVIFAIIALILLTVAVVAGVLLVRQQQDIREEAAPATTLAVIPSDLTPNVGETFTAALNINTGSNQVVGTELYVNYDPNILEAIEVTQGTFFVNPDAIGPQINNNTGTASYTLLLAPNSTPQVGSGTVANIRFRAKSAGTSTISFSPNSIVVAIGESGQNVLQSTTPGSVTVSSSQGQQNPPSPTPTEAGSGGIGGGSGSPTSTPTPSPSPSPTTTAGNGNGNSNSTVTPTKKATSTPTTFANNTDGEDSEDEPTQLPDSGIELPTLIGLGAVMFILFGALLFAL